MPKEPRSRFCRRCPGHPQQNQCVHTKAGLAYLALLDAQVESLEAAAAAPLGADIPDPTDVSIDPLLRTPSQGNQVPRDPTPSPAPKPIRIRVAPGTYGYVEGCTRGAHQLRIARTRALRLGQGDVKQASSRFRREIRNLIIRCERLSVETGCWLLLNAHHPHAHQASSIYASPRLRDEAMTETHDICSRFAKTTSVLVAARRTRAKELVTKLADMTEEKERALRDVDDVNEQLGKQQTELACMRVILDKLRAQGVQIPDDVEGDD
ncbi:hypothetical protein BDN72DRAFT_884023 [Pluteus cervinus]|uniref:Uncharacterized protein n=1 Tax=Pluteus cervinus TaxID=181527 RepID=A0ACD3A0N8_9AGAR|nr:hypothetical protein BDN72DRAFT_884023 [Pluteus cervinus]